MDTQHETETRTATMAPIGLPKKEEFEPQRHREYRRVQIGEKSSTREPVSQGLLLCAPVAALLFCLLCASVVYNASLEQTAFEDFLCPVEFGLPGYLGLASCQAVAQLLQRVAGHVRTFVAGASDA